ncbi:MAG: hypothetical protein ACREN5_09515, partial [Gemmatimonadales bacterium]
GLGLGGLTACSLGGFFVHPLDTGASSGYNRFVLSGQICALTGGQCRSSAGAVSWGKGTVAPGQPAAAYARRIGEVRSYRRIGTTAPFGLGLGGGLFESCYGFLCQADSPTGNNGIVQYDGPVMTTGDTSGDGWVNGGGGPLFGAAFRTSPTCAFNTVLVTWFFAPFGGYPQLQPTSARWKDTTVCNYVGAQPGGALAQTGNPYSTSSTEVPGSGIAAFQQNAAGLDGMFSKLPFETKLELLNSVDTSKDVRIERENGKPIEVMRLYLTRVRIGGRSYSPADTYFDVRDMKTMTVDTSSPGWRLTQAWLAAQLEDLLARQGGTMSFANLRWSVTLNDAVTISQEELGRIGGSAGFDVQFANPTQEWVADLRRNAAFGRGE